MSATLKTGIFVAVAAVLVLAAVFGSPKLGESGRFTEEGELFFPDFKDALQAHSLEVVQVDKNSVTGRVFKVQRDKRGVWTIPSHYGYPADAEDRMAEAASILIGLRKGAVRSDSRMDQKKLGVLDPLTSGADLEGRGMKLVLKDESEQVLGALIIGKPVPDREGMRFVRLPDSRRTYIAKIEVKLSTRFADWVETDLLGIDTYDIQKLTFDNYSIDEEQGVIVPEERIVARKETGTWTIDDLKEGEEVDTEKLAGAARVLSDLTIVGVRPKPAGLTERLRLGGDFERQLLQQDLISRGYFLDSQGRLRSNEGDLFVHTRDGVVYTLMFGEIAAGTSDEVSAGTEKSEEEGAVPGEDEARDPKAEATSSNRYLMVMATFDEDFFPKPEGDPLPEEEVELRRKAIQAVRVLVGRIEAHLAEHEALPESLDALLTDEEREDESAKDLLLKDAWGTDLVYTPGEEKAFTVTSLGADAKEGGEGANADIGSDRLEEEEDALGLGEKIKEWERKVKEGKEKADEASKRFAPWYYVIDASSFDVIRLSREDVVKPKVAEVKEGGEAGDEGGGDEATPPEGDDGKDGGEKEPDGGGDK